MTTPSHDHAAAASSAPESAGTAHASRRSDPTNGTHPPRPASESAPVLTYFTHPNRARLNVFLMRHASAGTRRINPKLDVKRPLDKEGKRHCLHLAHVLSALKVSFDLIVSSPLKRCLQTAQLIGTEMGYEARILHAQALEPGADYAQFQRLLHESRNYENVLMVGHNPTLTAFLGQMISETAARPQVLDQGMPQNVSHGAAASVRLRKGSIARLTVERGPATLQWLLEPRIVRSLYDTSTKSSRRKTSRK